MRFPHLFVASAAVTLVISVPSWAQFTITPTFTTAINNDPNAAVIKNTINSAIGVYQSMITNPVNINITFDKMTTGLGQSSWLYYTTSYATFYTQLAGKATSPNDTTALAHVSNGTNTINPVTGTSQIFVKAANLIALGYSGIDNATNTITLNTTITTPGSSGTTAQYSLLAVTEHEIDEILGLGSSLDFDTSNPLPEDLFRYDGSGARSFTTSTSASSFFSINGTTKLAQFNQTGSGDHADWQSSPRPNGTSPQVQDAFATAGASPTLGANEIAGLDVIGYTFSSAGAAPEPTASAMLLTGAGFLAALARRRRA